MSDSFTVRHPLYRSTRGTSVAVLILLAVNLLVVSAIYPQEKQNADFKLAVGLYKDGMYDLAADQFQSLIAASPATPEGIEARFYLGLAQMGLRRYEEAQATFQNFALTYIDHPRAPEAWLNVGSIFLILGKKSEAASAYERIRTFQPKSSLVPDALVRAAELYRDLNDRAHARRLVERVIQDYPSSEAIPSARITLAKISADEGQNQPALREARRAADLAKLSPLKAEALGFIGKLQEDQCLFDEAESTFQRIITKFGSTSQGTRALIELGRLDIGAGKFATAIQRLETAAARDSAADSLQAEALLLAGIARERQGDFAGARKTLTSLAEKFPESSAADDAVIRIGWDALHDAVVRAGPGAQDHGIREALERTERLLSAPASPKRRQAIALAARLSAAMKNFEAAARFDEQYVREFPDEAASPGMALSAGKLYEERLSDSRKAIAGYDQILLRYPRSAQAAEAMKRSEGCHESIGDPDGASQIYAAMRQHFPALASGPETERRVEELNMHSPARLEATLRKVTHVLASLSGDSAGTGASLELGNIYLDDLRDYAAAANQFNRSIRQGDESEETYLRRARACEMLSRSDAASKPAAVSAYQEFLNRFPGSQHRPEAAYALFMLRTGAPKPADVAAFLGENPSSPHTADLRLLLADASMAERDYPEARRQYRMSIAAADSAWPQRTRALVGEGRCSREMGNTDSALIAFRYGAAGPYIDSSTAVALRDLASLCDSLGLFEEGISARRRLIGEFFYCGPGLRADSLQLADALASAGKYDDAVAIYRTLISEERVSPFPESSSPEISFRLAEALRGKGDSRGAAEAYRRSVSDDRRSFFASRALYTLGVLARSSGDAGFAPSYFRQAAALGGTETVTADIADMLFQTEQYDAASRAYARLAQPAGEPAVRSHLLSRAIVSMLRSDQVAEAEKLMGEYEKAFGKSDSSQAEFGFERGMQAYRNQDYTTARRLFEKVAGKDVPWGPRAAYYIAKILEVTGVPDEAAKRYESILQDSPGSDIVPRVLLSLGNMHFNAERFEQAIGFYRQIVDQGDRSGDVLPYAMSNLIEAYESTKLYDASLRITRDFIARYPNDETIVDKKIKIGVLYSKMGYYDQAVTQFQGLIGEAGSDLEAELRYDIGEAYYNKGDYQQAILEFLKVPYLVFKQGKVNWTATSLYMAGQSYEKMSKFDEAVGMYQQIVERTGIDATFKAAAKKEIDRVRTVIQGEGK